RDDGHRILSSDIKCISIDGKFEQNLTNTNEIHEMYPICSPNKNMIICSSLDGDIFIINYEVMR
ncbi:MAG: hypothetical protein N3A61_02850, partial [Ignavibacteria bacterium]|nr:hypothetical protein [Ignavibacteria bacterium]